MFDPETLEPGRLDVGPPHPADAVGHGRIPLRAPPPKVGEAPVVALLVVGAVVHKPGCLMR